MSLKKSFLLYSALALAIIMMAMAPEKSSSGAPASHTGAPGEQTCAASGCHDDYAVNSGTANVKISLGGIKKYVANNTYPIKIRITDANVRRFGFQIVALADSDSSNIGTFTITDAHRTQQVRNMYSLYDRNYVTYTFDGTDAISSGIGEWTMNWIAPSANAGPVTFYVSAVSANDNMEDDGDYVYTTSTTIMGQ